MLSSTHRFPFPVASFRAQTARGVVFVRLIARLPLGLLVAIALAFTSRPSSAQNSSASPQDYETPGTINAKDFLPPAVFSGKKIYVQKTAQNNGLQNTYRITANGQEYEVTGSAAALQLWQELRAINQLRQISTAKAVTRGLTNSAKETYQTGKEIYHDPIGSVKKVPQGVSRFFGKIKETLSQDKEDSESNSSISSTAKNILGVDDAKRKLAARLGVDVYSRNETLQAELNRVATAMAGGGIAFSIGTLPIGGAVGVGLTAVGIEQTVNSLINDSSPEELRKWSETTLSKLGARPANISSFLSHPWYSPRQETIITAVLKKAGVDPNLFLETANQALTDQDGRYYQQVAQLLALYSEKVAPLQSLRLVDGVICGVDQNGKLVVPVSFDYAIWTEIVARRVDSLVEFLHSDPAIKSATIYTDGKLSDRLKSELSQRSIGFETASLSTSG
jgi:hypothetical protein